jgi:hypothetical protein
LEAASAVIGIAVNTLAEIIKAKISEVSLFNLFFTKKAKGF